MSSELDEILHEQNRQDELCLQHYINDLLWHTQTTSTPRQPSSSLTWPPDHRRRESWRRTGGFEGETWPSVWLHAATSIPGYPSSFSSLTGPPRDHHLLRESWRRTGGFEGGIWPSVWLVTSSSDTCRHLRTWVSFFFFLCDRSSTWSPSSQRIREELAVLKVEIWNWARRLTRRQIFKTPVRQRAPLRRDHFQYPFSSSSNRSIWPLHSCPPSQRTREQAAIWKLELDRTCWRIWKIAPSRACWQWLDLKDCQEMCRLMARIW